VTIAEVKSLTPLTDVYELKADTKYLFCFDICPPPEVINGFARNPAMAGVQGAIVTFGDGMKIYELGGQDKCG
jgi:hypothetical protein